MIKSIKSISWAVFNQILQFVAQFANLIILSRILLPEDFAIFAIGAIIISLVMQVFAMGLSPALIQMDNHEKYYSTAWSSNMVVTFLISISLIVFFPLIINNFYSQYVEYIIYFQLLSISIIFTGLKNIGLVELYRSRNVKRLTIIRGFSAILQVIFTLIIFQFLPDFRALFFGFIFIAFFKLIISYLIAPNKSKFGFVLDDFKKLYSFGGWLQLKNLIQTIASEIDSLTVGALLMPISLGYYSRAITLSRTQEVIISNFSDLFTFPFLSRKKGSKNYFSQLFEINYHILLLLIGSVSLIILSYGKQIINILLGELWISILPPLQLLIVSFGIGSLMISFFPFLRALGHTRIEFKLYLLKLVILTLLLYPIITFYGMLGAATANLIATIVTIPLFVYLTNKVIYIDIKNFIISVLIYISTGLFLFLIFPSSSPNGFIIIIEIFLQVFAFVFLSSIIIYMIIPNSFYVKTSILLLQKIKKALKL